jgi:hypothetical protein
VKKIILFSFSVGCLLFSSCASTPLKPSDVNTKGKQVEDSLYHYSLVIPDGWVILDNESFTKLDSKQQDMVMKIKNSKDLDARFVLFHRTFQAVAFVIATRHPFADNLQQVIQDYDIVVRKTCEKNKHDLYCKTNDFEQLTDRNYYIRNRIV